jgi:hypothetical protein
MDLSCASRFVCRDGDGARVRGSLGGLNAEQWFIRSKLETISGRGFAVEGGMCNLQVRDWLLSPSNWNLD